MRIRPIIITIAFFSFANFVHAQIAPSGPQMFITWKATDSSAPITYGAKTLPGINSNIAASIEVISGNSIVNLKSRTIYWYLDGGLVGGGLGKQTINFAAPGHVEIASLRVEIPDYPGGLLVRTARIQVSDPKVVIVAPYPGLQFSQFTVQLHADPYFFTLADFKKLNFIWTVNGQPVTTAENPQDLTINLPASISAGYSLSAALTVLQNDDASINAHTSVNLTKSR